MLLRFGKMNAHTFALPMIYVNGDDCFVNMKLNVYYGRLSCKDYVYSFFCSYTTYEGINSGIPVESGP